MADNHSQTIYASLFPLLTLKSSAADVEATPMWVKLHIIEYNEHLHFYVKI